MREASPEHVRGLADFRKVVPGLTEQFDRPTDQEREELFRMDLDGLNIKDQTIRELVRLTGPRDSRPGLTLSDLRSKLSP